MNYLDKIAVLNQGKKTVYISRYAATAKALKRRGYVGDTYSANAFMKEKPSKFRNKNIVVDPDARYYTKIVHYLIENNLPESEQSKRHYFTYQSIKERIFDSVSGNEEIEKIKHDFSRYIKQLDNPEFGVVNRELNEFCHGLVRKA